MTTIRNVTVIGGGLMGAGIAEVSAIHGFNVTVVERTAALAAKSRTNVEHNLRQYADRTYGDERDAGERFWRSTVARLAYTTSLAEGVRSADLVIEAIVEVLLAKHELFAAIDKCAPAHCLVTTNTSSLSVNAIGRALSASRRRQFAGLHFFTPVDQTQLVEIVRCTDTVAEAHGQLEHFVRAIGKQSLTCKDTPGFVVNGLLVPLVAGAMHMVETGVASATDVDRAMRLALAHPIGPLQLADYIGLDVCQNVTDVFAADQPDNRLYRGRMLKAMVARGELGIKSGKGFYDYKRAKL